MSQVWNDINLAPPLSGALLAGGLRSLKSAGVADPRIRWSLEAGPKVRHAWRAEAAEPSGFDGPETARGDSGTDPASPSLFAHRAQRPDQLHEPPRGPLSERENVRDGQTFSFTIKFTVRLVPELFGDVEGHAG